MATREGIPILVALVAYIEVVTIFCTFLSNATKDIFLFFVKQILFAAGFGSEFGVHGPSHSATPGLGTEITTI